MMKPRIDHAVERERALANGLREVATELRLVDLADLVTYIRSDQSANIRDLISSSIELYFKPGTLRYGGAGDLDLQWDGVPAVMFDMAFEHRDVMVHFRLRLDSAVAGVEIDYISFADPDRDPRANTDHLIEALADARLGTSRQALG